MLIFININRNNLWDNLNDFEYEYVESKTELN